MAFPGNVNRYVISGTLPGGERWATGFYGDPTLPGTAQALADDFDNAGSLGLAFLTALRAQIQPGGSITRIQTYVYGAGRTIIDQGDASLNLAGTSASALLPNQTCLVLTLRTATRSRRGRGRMYLPADGLLITADSTFSAAPVQAMVNAAGAALDFYNARVVSEAATASYPVNRVDADRVPDVQRRRADAQQTARLGYTFP